MLRMLGQLFAKKSLLHFAFISINLDIFNTKFDYSGVLNTSGGGHGD